MDPWPCPNLTKLIQFYENRSRSLFYNEDGTAKQPLKKGTKIKVTDEGKEWLGKVDDVLLDSKDIFWIRGTYEPIKGRGLSQNQAAIKDPQVLILHIKKCVW